MDIGATLGTWVGAILTLMVLSFLYKQNPLFRIVEHVMIGLGAGYFLAWGVKNVNDIAIAGITRGDYFYIIPLLLGILFYARISKRFGWLSRWSVALIIGVSTSLFLRGALETNLIAQILAAGKSLAIVDAYTTFNNILLLIITVCVLTYFIYTKEHKGALGATSKIGRWGMMVAFGIIFGGVVASRMTTMIGVIQFLLDWLRTPIIP